MANTIKTAISLQKSLFEQVETMAHELNVSRSRLFVLALEDFIRRYHNQQLLEQINRAYEDLPDPAEQAFLAKMRRQHRRIVKGEW
jgi:metal-responsive CopG/Arc/MetJ family transcriptional regulator